MQILWLALWIICISERRAELGMGLVQPIIFLNRKSWMEVASVALTDVLLRNVELARARSTVWPASVSYLSLKMFVVVPRGGSEWSHRRLPCKEHTSLQHYTCHTHARERQRCVWLSVFIFLLKIMREREQERKNRKKGKRVRESLCAGVCVCLQADTRMIYERMIILSHIYEFLVLHDEAKLSLIGVTLLAVQTCIDFSVLYFCWRDREGVPKGRG